MKSKKRKGLVDDESDSVFVMEHAKALGAPTYTQLLDLLEASHFIEMLQEAFRQNMRGIDLKSIADFLKTKRPPPTYSQSELEKAKETRIRYIELIIENSLPLIIHAQISALVTDAWARIMGKPLSKKEWRELKSISAQQSESVMPRLDGRGKRKGKTNYDPQREEAKIILAIRDLARCGLKPHEITLERVAEKMGQTDANGAYPNTFGKRWSRMIGQHRKKTWREYVKECVAAI